MSKEIYISSTPHETRLAIVEKDELTEIYYERENEYTLAGSIYNGRVTRVLPGMQSSFVDVGLERDAFLYITDFMEEQGDAADFESGSASGEGRNGQRRERGEGRGRGRREEEPAAEPEARAEAKAEAPAQGSGNGSVPGGERGGGERGGERRRRERGRRDEREPARASSPDTGFDAPLAGAEPAKQPSLSESRVADGIAGERTDERGEGTPDEEGSRRWRGRRGRRRGRPGSGEGAAPADERVAAEPISAPDEEPELAEAIFSEAPATLPESRESRSRERSPERGQDHSQTRAAERPGREGRREERAGRGERDGSRTDRSGTRGSRSGARRDETSGYGDDTGSTSVDLQGSAEPFILPGESLSKYRPGGETADAAAHGTRPSAPMLTVKPSTQIELPGVWDGGATLPGETLSRYRERPSAAQTESRNRPAEARSAPKEEDRAAASVLGGTAGSAVDGTADGAPGRNRRRDRDQRRWREEPNSQGGESLPDGRSAQAETPDQGRSARALSDAEAVQPGVSSFHEAEDLALPLNDNGSPRESFVQPFSTGLTENLPEPAYPEPAYEAQTDLAPLDRAEPTPPVLEAVEEFHETVTEYEPEENAAASYRVDPAGPSEFRQSSLEALEAPEAPEFPASPDAEVAVPVRFEENRSLARAEDLAAAPAAASEESGHQFTAVQPTGEMISEWPLVPELEAAANGAELAGVADAPIQHEAAVQSVDLAHAEAPTAATPQAFAPGAGQLEEELLDEDDADLPRLEAGFAGDDMEEEVLEGTADLGSMIRDLSIDTITSHDAADDEDDFSDEEMEEDELEAEEELEAGQFAEEESFAEEDESAGDSFAESGDGEFAETASPQRPSRSATSGDSEARAAAPDRPEREEDHRERRGGRRGSRDRNSRDRRPGGHNGGRMTRHQAQTSDLPAISDLLKPGQEVLVQIAKEPIAKKGARITSHIALPGRFLVFMPTVQHVGVSRKIESDSERRRLKEILISERGEASGGFIVRTAASGASEEELRSDLRFLLNLWADIKQRSESSKSPALIYHDLNLVERILRDQVTDNFSAIWVDTETEYERVLRFLQRFQPSLIRRVKLYTKDTPLFEQFGITEEINKALRSKVWLKSGGSIVINQTEALVAIDINTGKYVGKTARLEDTIVKTNLDAIPEIVRQIRLRDLGGIIVIDFIDMDERKNRAKVLAAIEEELKTDRAPSKVLPFNDFGLVVITRKRVKQSLERTLSITCSTCAGTGMVKSPTTVCNEIYIELRKMHKHLDKGDVMLRVNPEVVKQLKSVGGKWLQEMEEISGKTILVKSDPSLHPEQFDIQ